MLKVGQKVVWMKSTTAPPSPRNSRSLRFPSAPPLISPAATAIGVGIVWTFDHPNTKSPRIPSSTIGRPNPVARENAIPLFLESASENGPKSATGCVRWATTSDFVTWSITRTPRATPPTTAYGGRRRRSPRAFVNGERDRPPNTEHRYAPQESPKAGPSE